MLWTPACGFQWNLNNVAGVTPAAQLGTSVTPGASNVEGSWVELFDTIPHDCYLIRIFFCNTSGGNNLGGTALADIGIDPAGGTTYVEIINGLGVGPISPSIVDANTYTFPLFIPAGSSIAARIQSALASPPNAAVLMELYGLPQKPELVKAGRYVRSFGVVDASSQGTSFTPGNATKGSWVSLGTTGAEPLWWWQLGFTHTATSGMAERYHMADLAFGDGTTKLNILTDVPHYTASSESIRFLTHHGARRIPGSSELFVRSIASAAPTAGHGAIAYGVGG